MNDEVVVRTLGGPEQWEAIIDDLPLEPVEEPWLLSDRARIKGLDARHLVVISNRRLLAVGHPPTLPVLFTASRESLSMGFSNRLEVQLNRSGRDLSRQERSVRLLWVGEPDNDMILALRGMLAGERPAFSDAAAGGFSLLPVWYVGGHGCSVVRNTEGTLIFNEHGVRFLSRRTSAVWEVPVDALTSIEFGGPGRWRKGGRFIGGGFGAVGAAEGMLVAGVLNSLTTRTGITTIVHLEAGPEMSTWWHHADRYTPQDLEIELSWMASALRGRTSSSSVSSGDFIEKLTRLTELHRSGALSDEEFGAAKAKLLAD